METQQFSQVSGYPSRAYRDGYDFAYQVALMRSFLRATPRSAKPAKIVRAKANVTYERFRRRDGSYPWASCSL
jgi:hypothetical protein